MVSIFEAKSYRDYLNAKLGKTEPGKKRTGALRNISQFLKCHPTHISQVTLGRADLNLDQVFGVCSYLGLSKEETEHFFDLYQFEKAGTKDTKKFFSRKIEERISDRQKVASRLRVNGELAEEVKEIYYESWVPLAIHYFCQLPRDRSLLAISNSLGLPKDTVKRLLDFLERHGLVRQENSQYLACATSLHLDKGSLYERKMHSNWRIRAIQKFEIEGTENGRHFSTVITMDRNTAKKLDAALLALIEQMTALVVPAPTERLYALSFDFYDLESAHKS